jgi:hypothetical protein
MYRAWHKGVKKLGDATDDQGFQKLQVEELLSKIGK